MSTKITTFIFDCFGVVSYPVLGGWYEINREQKGFKDENIKEVFKKYDLGIWSDDQIVEYFSKYDGVRLTKEELKKEIYGTLRLNGELIEIIRKLKTKGFKTALLSNASHTYFENEIYPKFPEFKNLFDQIVISSSVGMMKPDPNIFLYTLKKLSSKPDECIFIDDSKENIDATTKLGINPFLFTETKPFADYLQNIGIIV